MLMKRLINQGIYTALKSEQQRPEEAHPEYILSVEYDFYSFIPNLWNISDNIAF